MAEAGPASKEPLQYPQPPRVYATQKLVLAATAAPPGASSPPPHPASAAMLLSYPTAEWGGLVVEQVGQGVVWVGVLRVGDQDNVSLSRMDPLHL